MADIIRVGRGYARKSGHTVTGAPYLLWLSGPDDISARNAGYSAECAYCWLGQGHTAEAHAGAVVTA